MQLVFDTNSAPTSAVFTKTLGLGMGNCNKEHYSENRRRSNPFDPAMIIVPVIEHVLRQCDYPVALLTRYCRLARMDRTSMPSQTFFNLKHEKRNRFIEVSLHEFCTNSFREASVSHIVDELGIAKGSVYQYFKNKKDLYLYLVDRAVKSKFNHIEKSLEESLGEGAAASADFYTLYSEIILAGADFDFGNPSYSLLITNAMQEHDTRELESLPDDLVRRSSEFLNAFVRRGITRGEIRRDVDPALIVHLVNSITLSLTGYLEEKYDFSLPEQLRHPDRALPFSDNQLKNAVYALMEVIRTGLFPRK